jgi:hypothetical protein
VGISGNFLGFLPGGETSAGSYMEEVVSHPKILVQSSGNPMKTRPAMDAEREWDSGDHLGTDH